MKTSEDYFFAECVAFSRYIVYTKIAHDQQFPCLLNHNCNVIIANIKITLRFYIILYTKKFTTFCVSLIVIGYNIIASERENTMWLILIICRNMFQQLTVFFVQLMIFWWVILVIFDLSALHCDYQDFNLLLITIVDGFFKNYTVLRKFNQYFI